MPSPKSKPSLDRVGKAIEVALRKMDAEARPTSDGSPTGLGWYGGHAEPDLKRPRTEPSWSRRLAELLSAAGIPADSEIAYPDNPRHKCDVVIRADAARIWIEVKGAWRSYWGGKNKIYRSYLLHPLLPNLDPKTHTVPLDLKKMERLTRDDCDMVACLLVGFDVTTDPMDVDIKELERLSKLGRAPWTLTRTATWNDKQRRGERVRFWLWTRPV